MDRTTVPEEKLVGSTYRRCEEHLGVNWVLSYPGVVFDEYVGIASELCLTC